MQKSNYQDIKTENKADMAVRAGRLRINTQQSQNAAITQQTNCRYKLRNYKPNMPTRLITAKTVMR